MAIPNSMRAVLLRAYDARRKALPLWRCPCRGPGRARLVRVFASVTVTESL